MARTAPSSERRHASCGPVPFNRLMGGLLRYEPPTAGCLRRARTEGAGRNSLPEHPVYMMVRQAPRTPLLPGARRPCSRIERGAVRGRARGPGGQSGTSREGAGRNRLTDHSEERSVGEAIRTRMLVGARRPWNRINREPISCRGVGLGVQSGSSGERAGRN